MPTETLPPEPPVDAGEFSFWLAAFSAALRGSSGTEVPCGDCTGCCTSGYSLQLRSTDSAALALIPASLLQRVEGFAAGERTLPARPDGRCRMLDDGRCSIYAARPQTCLDYDCRVFAAAGIAAGGDDKAVINRRVHAWRFSYADESARRAHAAVREAARFLRERRDAFDVIGARVPGGPMGIAVFAVKAHAALLAQPPSRDAATLARALVEAARRFDATR
jgi:Fe-S-cluster containining protein